MAWDPTSRPGTSQETSAGVSKAKQAEAVRDAQNATLTTEQLQEAGPVVRPRLVSLERRVEQMGLVQDSYNNQLAIDTSTQAAEDYPVTTTAVTPAIVAPVTPPHEEGDVICLDADEGPLVIADEAESSGDEEDASRAQ